MNPDFLADGRANFRFDALDEAHAHPAEFIGRADDGGYFQRGFPIQPGENLQIYGYPQLRIDEFNHRGDWP